MNWRDQLQPASFRGVPFKVDSHSAEFGRRVVVHEYPLRDEPYAEDLGRKTRGYQIDAYVIGPDYMADRDALREALEQSGPGTLVHRYLGQLRVQVTDVRLRESSREGGMATFSISVVEAGEIPAPVTKQNTQQLVSSKADIALASFQLEFLQYYSLIGFPGWITSSAIAVINNLQRVLAVMGVADTAFSQYAASPSQLAAKITDVLSSVTATSLLNNDASVFSVNSIGVTRGDTTYSGLSTGSTVVSQNSVGSGNAIYSFAGNPTANITTVLPLTKLFSYGNDLLPVPTTVLSRQKQSSNQGALINLVRGVALVEAARQASQQAYSSQQQAVFVRDYLADALDVEMLTASDDRYQVLQDLRVALIRDLTDRLAQLKRIRQYIPKATLPALVIAHQLYQDANKEADIVSRNGIHHPGFVTGGNTLEVLNA